MMVRNASVWERGFLREDIFDELRDEKEFRPDILVLRLGENVLPEHKPFFKDALVRFIENMCDKKTRVIFTTCFWKNDIIDDAIVKVAKERSDICLDCFLAGDDSNMALGLFEHHGVSIHPGDKGMDELANIIFNGILKLVK